MTYCLGWKYQGVVYLVADSAVTSGAPPSLPRSSVGETQYFTNTYSVEEGLLKIVPIENNFVVAYAGDVSKAATIIEFIKSSLGIHEDIYGLIKSITRSLGPFVTDRAVSLIIGTTVDQDLDLVRWESNDPSNIIRGNDLFQVGSVQSFHGVMTRAILSLLVSGRLPLDRMLPISTAIIQSYGVHDHMMSQHIGGMIYGLSVDKKDGVRWQEDTKYILYDPAFRDIGVVTCLCRENALAIRSSITNDTRILYHSSNILGPNEWMAKWKPELEKDFKSGCAKYWAFISKRDRNITVVKLPEKSYESKYFRLSHTGEGIFDFAVDPKFIAMLNSPVTDRGDSSIPFRLTSLDG